MKDPGLASERTVLAWSRTALGIVGVAALLLRFARVESVPAAGEVIAAGAVLVAGLAWWHGRRSYGVTLRPAGPVRALSLAVAAIAAGTAAVVAVGLAS